MNADKIDTKPFSRREDAEFTENDKNRGCS